MSRFSVRATCRRVIYRVGQFVRALGAYLSRLSEQEWAQVHGVLPERAWPLFSALSRNDQRHSLRVLCAVQSAGHDNPALLQAALLHDAGKGRSGLTPVHRAIIVLLRIWRPALLARWATGPAPARSHWRFPFWAHAHHPARGAEWAAAAGCDPLAVLFIRHHQGPPPVLAQEPRAARLLAALQMADDKD